MTDVIVYTVWAEPGGEDGMSSDKGGPVSAYLEKDLAVRQVGKDCRYRLEKTVEDLDEVFLAVRKKLTPLERLALEYHAIKRPLR